MLTRLKSRNVIDDVSFMEQTAEYQKRLNELRQRRIKILNEDEDEASIEALRALKNLLDSVEGYLLLFDEKIFSAMVEQITVLNTGFLLYKLKCGLRLKEKI